MVISIPPQFIFLLIFAQLLFSQIALPESRKGDWMQAGYLRFLTDDITITRLINVLSYGVTNDSTDDNNNNQKAINQALAEAQPQGITLIYFPTGIYRISSPLEMNDQTNVIFRGDGALHTRFIFNFDNSESLSCIKIHRSEKIGLENFYLEREDFASYGDNITITGSQNCWIIGIESHQPAAIHVLIYSSNNIDIHGCYFHHAWNYGVGGHGYGVNLGGGTEQCLVENNIFYYLRHSIIISNYLNSNVFAYNYSTHPYTTEKYFGVSDWPSDFCLHGHPSDDQGPTRNLFEGNIGAFMHADNTWQDNGPYNTYFRNRATYYGIKIAPSSNNQNIIANEIDDCDGSLNDFIDLWNEFSIQSDSNFIIGNTNFDLNPVEYPNPSDYSSDLSLYFKPEIKPSFLNTLDYWPSIGVVDDQHRGGGTIPAKIRWDSGSVLTENHPEYSLETTVSISVSGEGTVTPIGESALCLGDEITCIAQADQGSMFNQWLVSDGITILDTSSSGIFKIMAQGTITAHFSPMTTDTEKEQFFSSLVKPDHLQIYPNHTGLANKSITFLFSSSTKAMARLTIFDWLGRVILNREFTLSPNAGKLPVLTRWNMNNNLGRRVSQGVYMVVLKVDRGFHLDHYKQVLAIY